MWGAPNDPRQYRIVLRTCYIRLRQQVYMATFYPPCRRLFNFCSGHRWGYFPSASVGWNVTNEKFMEPVTKDGLPENPCKLGPQRQLCYRQLPVSFHYRHWRKQLLLRLCRRRDHRLEPRPPCKYRYQPGKNRSSSTSASTHASSTAVSASPSTGTARLLATGSCRLLSFCRTVAALPYMKQWRRAQPGVPNWRLSWNDRVRRP